MRSITPQAADYRALLTLAGDLHAMPADGPARRAAALARVAPMLGARAALFVQTATLDGRYRMLQPTMLGLDDVPPSRLAAYFGGEMDVDPCAPEMERAAPGHAARREQLVDDRRWYRSRYYNEMRGPLGFDDGVYARADSPGGGVFGICFLRDRADRRGFGERHRAVLGAFARHVAPLCLLDAPADRLARLPPRLRAVAERFCAGDSVKEAARHLGLSPHTVTEYAKQIHRAYGVSSRGELLAKLMGGLG